MTAFIRTAAAAGCLLATLVPGSAADRAVALEVPPDLAKDLSAMPRIANPVDDAERRINAAVQRLDGAARKAAAECLAQGGKHADYGRHIDVTMRGPRFLSYTMTDSAFCGGARPNTGTSAIVYDLVSGAPIDWTALLPPALTGKVALQTEMDGSRMVSLSSKRLFDLYLKAYRPRTGQAKADADDDECRDAVSTPDGDGPPAMTVWLDAKAGGLAVQFDLAHVVQACADVEVIPLATLKAEGANAVLTDAIVAARAALPVP
ncbi:hypothetical protein [Methylobacterium sp.]|uniref:hypothetical protein n=1 Tax=Methylobacterium sp. TaxID=409 RepID=UPI003B01B8AF